MSTRLTTYFKLHKFSILFVFFSLVFYYTLAYQLERIDFIKLLTLFLALFFFYLKLIQFEKWNYRFLLAAGILARVVFLPMEPHLSQDFYRFIWDGELVSNFMNPYVEVPNILIKQPDLIIANAQELYMGMGDLSARHYSNYPPLNQLLFALAALLGGKTVLGSIIAMRSIIILADIGIFYFGRKLLKKLNCSPHLIFWYFLNPLVIVELTGNLHFEGAMLFFFVWSMYLLSIKKWQWAAVVFGCSISIKLVPLLFLPLFLNYLGVKRSILFYIIVLSTLILSFAPFYTFEFVSNYSQTLSLWFSNFEFNAGIYNLIKQIAVHFDQKPWEFIKTYGKITPLITVSVVLLLTFFGKNRNLLGLMTSMMWALTIYYLISTTVHPWYIVFLVLLASFTSYRYALIWSAAIILSYFAYSQVDFKENLLLLAIEYISVLGFICYEFFAHPNKK
ncbi:mannosyltransferase [Maribacter sp. MMG018]|uniref:mannosyltransferase n=1 Tax=Maribacter sp. MMG018 TaxID=2822688 RepID=UPI001B36DDD8|nr:mannosyltransferase [Maribacter sp. MMG018]MBQ4912972.1 mannosyltransferase [Maribacter sp. MMG018]